MIAKLKIITFILTFGIIAFTLLYLILGEVPPGAGFPTGIIATLIAFLIFGEDT